MGNSPKEIRGRTAEDEAVAWWSARLRAGGGRILARNVRFRFGEIDLVVEEGVGPGATLVLIEVRSRAYASVPRFRPLDTLSHAKRRRIERAGEAYLRGYRGSARRLRFDFLIREEASGSVHWTHLPGAW